MNYPTNSDDVIDSRDVIEAIRDIEATYDPADDDAEEMFDALTHLRNLAAQGEDVDDWDYGVVLVRDDYWQTYAEEFWTDVYGSELELPEYARPYVTIDWEMWARDLQMDYTAVDFDGVTYWVR